MRRLRGTESPVGLGFLYSTTGGDDSLLSLTGLIRKTKLFGVLIYIKHPDYVL